MQFLYPTFLWALSALAIPIIIHLFYFRRFKKVNFTNVKYLKEIKEETSSRNKLKNLLVLLMRCLALACLVFAFAQPFIPTGSDIKLGEKTIGVFVDNSYSMRAERESIPLLDLAKQKASSVINAYSESDKFQVLTHDFEGRHQRLLSKEDALSMVEEIKITPVVQELSNVINRQKQVLNGDNKISYLISDFQSTITDITNWSDTTLELNLMPIQSAQEKNLSIDSVWFAAPVPILNQTNDLIIKVTNHSDVFAKDVKTSLLKDGQTKPIGVKDIPARTSVTDTVSISILKPGIHKAEVIVKDYPVQFDDRFFISFDVAEEVKVLTINGATTNKYLKALFDGISYFSQDNQSVAQVQFQKFQEYDLILLNDLTAISSGMANELKQYIANGGKVMVFPSSNADLSSYNNFLASVNANRLKEWEKKDRSVNKINSNDFVFEDVYINTRNNLKLPVTTGNFTTSNIILNSARNLLSYRDGSSYISKFLHEKGQVYLSVSPLASEYNDLVTNAEVFVPMLYKIALFKPEGTKLGWTIGKDNLIEVENKRKAGEVVYKISGASEFIPGQTNLGKKIILDVKGQITEAGYYNLSLDDNNLQQLAFNFDRQESDLSVLTNEQITDRIKNDGVNIIDADSQDNISEYVGQKDKGLVLWKWFLIGALIFLLLESILVRLSKT